MKAIKPVLSTRLVPAMLLLCALPPPTPQACAQGGVPLWTNCYNGPGNSNDYAVAIAVDSGGSVFVTGYSRGNGTGYDYATVAYSSAGMPLWTNYYSGPGTGDDYATGVAVNSAGKVFVTGYSDNGINDDFATVAYSNSGVPLWTNRYEGPGRGFDLARAVAVDSSGSVFVTGESWGGIAYSYATIKYSGEGLALWTNRYRAGNTEDGAYAIAVDSGGNVYVAGNSAATNSFYDYATLAYSGAGVLLWTNRYNGPGNYHDGANAIAADSNGNVFVTGLSNGPKDLPDYATVAYSSAGVPLWTNRYDGPGGREDIASALAVDRSGNVFVTGNSVGTNPSPFFGADYATVAYSSTGLPLWTNRYNGPTDSYDIANAVGVDNSGNVFVTGYSHGIGGDLDYVTLAYSSAGVPLWTNCYNGPGNSDDYAVTLAVDRIGNVFVAGSSWNGSNYDYTTIKYSLIPPSIYLQTTSDHLVLSWTNSAFSLQSAEEVSGTFTNIPAATSPYTNAVTGLRQYFRLQANY